MEENIVKRNSDNNKSMLFEAHVPNAALAVPTDRGSHVAEENTPSERKKGSILHLATPSRARHFIASNHQPLPVPALA